MGGVRQRGGSSSHTPGHGLEGSGGSVSWEPGPPWGRWLSPWARWGVRSRKSARACWVFMG